MKSHILSQLPHLMSPKRAGRASYRAARRSIYIVRRYPRRSWAALFMLLVIGASLFIYVGRAHADSQGPKGPGTAAGTSWTSPGNITAQDNVYASYSIASGGTTTALQATNFGFTIPTGATITGVQADIWKYSPLVVNAAVQDSSVQIIKGGTAGGTSQALTGTTWNTTNTKTTYGGSGNMWGQALAVSDVNASNFGISLTATNVKSKGGATNVAYVDYVQVTIYYTPPPSTVNQASYRLFNNKDATSFTYASNVDYPSGTSPNAVAVADVSGDNEPDIVTANIGANTVSVLLNNGSGTFATKVDYPTGASPDGVAIADVNGDGKPDIVVANNGANTVSVLLNNGSGTFATKVDYPTGTSPGGVAIADVNGDGKPDIVTADYSANVHTVSVLLNNGSGTFATNVDYPTGTGPTSVALADVNGDGKPDIVTADQISMGDTVSVLLNNGSGTFATNVDYPTGTNPLAVALADVNGDGKPDIVTANNGANTVSVLLNNGNGTFAAKVDYATGTGPYGVALADLNGDGKPDIVTANNTANTVSVLSNNGNGTFAAKSDYSVGNAPHAIALADLNGDGRTDIVTANSSASTTSVIMALSTPPMDVNAPLAGLNTAASTPGDGQPFRLRMDLGITASALTAGAGSYKLQYAPMTTSCDASFTNTPSSAYQDVTDYSAVRYYANTYGTNGATITDTNGYGPTDGSNPIVYESYQGKGTTTFTNPTAIPVGSDGMWDFALTTYHTLQNTSYCLRIVSSTGSLLNTYTTIPQINIPAAAFTQSGFRWFGSNNSGTGQLSMAAKSDYPTGTNPQGVATADLNGDGKPDIVVPNYGSNTVSVLLNNGDGTTFTNATGSPYTTGTAPDGVALADVNGDGKPDIVVSNYSSSTVSVLINNGNGTFAAKADYPTGTDPGPVAIADVNGDGKPDIVVNNTINGPGGNTVSVLINNGNGTFAAKVDYTTGAPGVALADVNGDGKPDIVVANASGNTVSVLLNNGNGTFAAKVDYPTGASPRGVALADVNGDGKPDIVVSNYSSNTVSVLINNGNGTFAAKVDYPTGANALGVALADVNGDGKPDIVVANASGNTVSVLLNNGNGTFAAKVDYPTGTGPYGVALADVNGDGKPDIVVNNQSANTVSVILNTSTTPIDVGSPLGSQNQIVDQGIKTTPLRLRLGIRMSGGGLAASSSFKLQYAIKNGTCAASTFADVTTSTPLQWYTTGVLTSGNPIGSDANDPTDGTNPVWDQTYQEANNFSSISPLYYSDNGVWDFSLAFASTAIPGTDVCLRAVTSTDTAFTTYSNYPEIQYGPTNQQHMRQGAWFDQNGVKQPLFTSKN